MTDSEILLQAVQYAVPVISCVVGLSGFSAASRERKSKDSEREARQEVIAEEQSKALARIEKKLEQVTETMVNHEGRLIALESRVDRVHDECEKLRERMERSA